MPYRLGVVGNEDGDEDEMRQDPICVLMNMCESQIMLCHDILLKRVVLFFASGYFALRHPSYDDGQTRIGRLLHATDSNNSE